MGIFSQSNNTVMNSLKSLNPRTIYKNIQLMNINWIDLASYFTGGLVCGFLCKRYLKDVITWALIAMVLVILLDYIGIVAIDWKFIQSVFGTSPGATVDGWLQAALAWAKGNVPFVISFVIGFTVGIKVG